MLHIIQKKLCIKRCLLEKAHYIVSSQQNIPANTPSNKQQKLNKSKNREM